ncbi:probable protein arginine N-methyltransferase 3 [Mercurialis annua]|uniref:probable protein arginine N-methyltransferase 3 n=1 Tax=Mercurialis annua TaxID=3986 RepID=UPI002160DDFA|nr:probable protein arginine N-methyltransferase 3 [Mercurialis annua]
MAKNSEKELNYLHHKSIQKQPKQELSEDDEEDDNNDGDWEDWSGDDESNSNYLCLFCDLKFISCIELLRHCGSAHKFDLQGIIKDLSLDIYGGFKLINYVRSMVAENRCWSCRVVCKSNEDLQCHLHEIVNLKDIAILWDDERYLKPFMQDDSLLYSVFGDDESEDDYTMQVDKEEVMRDFMNIDDIHLEDDQTEQTSASSSNKFDGNGTIENASVSKGSLNLAPRDVKKIDENYFGAYSCFGIHREMISDKVRMDAYRQALLKNPSLLTGAVVMDVGCGTGILSLFAAQAGASRVIAVEASEKMATVATQIAKTNGLWHNQNQGSNQCTGVMEVVQGMVEEIDKSIQIEPHSVDVLVSEWMGYCLLYETMLTSVLYARDKWLRPGGAILPDTATIYAAGFGKGGTSLPFWENAYGLDMSCIGRELLQDAAKIPIVDVVNECDLVTDFAVLQSFDLATMKPEEVDFTATTELVPLLDKVTWCYGVVLWFDTGFTTRFCKETPAVLSTSPYTPKTHWSQTLLTFPEPISISPARTPVVGTNASPASRIHLRISIVRAVEHRSIDISMETVAVGPDGQKRGLPVQLFNLS